MSEDPVQAAARRAYERAARSAAVTVRDLHSPRELEDARRLCDEVWPTIGGGTQVTSNLLKAIEHAGGYVVAAYDDDGEAVGAALAFLGRHRDDAGRWETHLHSHMAAVAAAGRDRGVGTALKLHQRWWALRHDVPVVAWTFDPLVRRNARLNLVKLGARAVSYLPDFYGEMDDEINAGDPTDRLLAWWVVRGERAEAAARGDLAASDGAALRAAGAVDAVRVVAGRPERDPAAADAAVALVALPDDIVAIRAGDPGLALAWRLAVRGALHDALTHGAQVTGFTADGAYVVSRPADEEAGT